MVIRNAVVNDTGHAGIGIDLTRWRRDKEVVILQTTFSFIKMYLSGLIDNKPWLIQIRTTEKSLSEQTMYTFTDSLGFNELKYADSYQLIRVLRYAYHACTCIKPGVYIPE